MYEPRKDNDGSHYVVESVSGHLAHVTDADGGQHAAVNLSADDAAKTADKLNTEARS